MHKVSNCRALRAFFLSDETCLCLFIISSILNVHYMKDFWRFVVRGVDVDRSSALQDVASTAKERP